MKAFGWKEHVHYCNNENIYSGIYKHMTMNQNCFERKYVWICFQYESVINSDTF